jgi:hypothetical protein
MAAGPLAEVSAGAPVSLRRALSLWDLVLFGLVTIQLTAPMPIYGVLYNTSRGHTVAVVLLSMLLTAVSYGRMASMLRNHEKHVLPGVPPELLQQPWDGQFVYFEVEGVVPR